MSGSSPTLDLADYTQFVEQGLDGMPQGYLLIGPTGDILGANAAAAEMVGLSRPVPVGARIADVFVEVHDFQGQPIPTGERPSARALATGRAVRETLVAVRRPDDTVTRWVEVTASPLFDATGRPWGVLEVLVDATERLEAERRLHRLASIVEATDHGAVVTDLDRRIEWVNPAFTRMTGYTPDEVVGHNPGELLQSPETDPQTVARMRTSLDEGEGFHEEVLNRDRQGRRRWIDLEVQPLLNHLGEHTHWMGLKRDITERRAVEAELRNMTRRAGAQTHALEIALERADELTREARAADRAKDEFLRTASHELRTPLGGALMAVSLLHDLVEDEQTLELAGIALESGEELLQRIDDVLHFAQLAAGEIEPVAGAVSLGALLGGLERMYRDTARTHGVEFVVECGAAALPRVRTDHGMLWRVLAILLDNAFALVEEGFVRLDLEATRVDERWDLLFLVRDTGRGIDADDRRRIFEPFVQADGSDRRDHPGIGLGLSIAREIAGRLGGDLDVREEPSPTTCFEFAITVPEAGADDDTSVVDISALDPLIESLSVRAPKILLAVGNGAQRPFLSRALRLFGTRVDVVDAVPRSTGDRIGVHHDLLLLAGNLERDTREELAGVFHARSKPSIHVPSRGDDVSPETADVVPDGFDLVALGQAISNALTSRV